MISIVQLNNEALNNLFHRKPIGPFRANRPYTNKPGRTDPIVKKQEIIELFNRGLLIPEIVCYYDGDKNDCPYWWRLVYDHVSIIILELDWKKDRILYKTIYSSAQEQSIEDFVRG